MNCGEPCSRGSPGPRRFSTGSGNGHDLSTVLECAYKLRGGSREDGDLRVDLAGCVGLMATVFPVAVFFGLGDKGTWQSIAGEAL